jgi:hypothetical protein
MLAIGPSTGGLSPYRLAMLPVGNYQAELIDRALEFNNFAGFLDLYQGFEKTRKYRLADRQRQRERGKHENESSRKAPIDRREAAVRDSVPK